MDQSVTFDSTDCATVAALITAMQAAGLATGLNRIFPIHKILNITDNSETPVKQTGGFGQEKYVRDGKYMWDIEFNEVGIGYWSKLRKLNDVGNLKVLLIFNDEYLVGTDDESDGIKGLSISAKYFHPWKISDGANPAKYVLSLSLAKPLELNEDITYIKFGQSIEDVVKGNIDVELILVASDSTSVTIKPVTSVGKVNLFDTYAADLDAAGAWVVSKAGVAVVPASVAQDTVNEAIKIPLTTPSGAHVFSLEDAVALAALGIGGAGDGGFETEATLAHTFS